MKEMNTTTREDNIRFMKRLSGLIKRYDKAIEKNEARLAEQRFFRNEYEGILRLRKAAIGELTESESNEIESYEYNEDDWNEDDKSKYQESDEEFEDDEDEEDALEGAEFYVDNIIWDKDVEDDEEIDDIYEDLDLPEFVTIPFDEIFDDPHDFYDYSVEEVEEKVMDYLTEEYGYCVESCTIDPSVGYNFDEDDDEDEDEDEGEEETPVFYVNEIEWDIEEDDDEEEDEEYDLPESCTISFSKIFDDWQEEYYGLDRDEVNDMVLSYLTDTFGEYICSCYITTSLNDEDEEESDPLETASFSIRGIKWNDGLDEEERVFHPLPEAYSVFLDEIFDDVHDYFKYRKEEVVKMIEDFVSKEFGFEFTYSEIKMYPDINWDHNGFSESEEE